MRRRRWVVRDICHYMGLDQYCVLINTEEKWLLGLYGQEYVDYCKRVNEKSQKTKMLTHCKCIDYVMSVYYYIVKKQEAM